MTDSKKSSTGTKIMTAGLVGVAVGAAGALLTDKKNQKKVAAQLDYVRTWSDKTITDLKGRIDTIAEDVSEKSPDDLKKEMKEQAKEVRDKFDEETPQTKSLN